MYIVALTGGIGSGKSEAAKLFAQLGVPIVDVDVIAHELTAIGSPMLQHISRMFGSDVLNADGSLNRVKLRTLVFKNPEERGRLEGLLHPAIYDKAIAQLKNNESSLHPDYQILVIPLLFESNRYRDVVDRILVIDCDENLQISRAMSRSNLSADEVKAMMATQTSRELRLNHADEVIENAGSLAELVEKVNNMHNKLIKTCIVTK